MQFRLCNPSCLSLAFELMLPKAQPTKAWRLCNHNALRKTAASGLSSASPQFYLLQLEQSSDVLTLPRPAFASDLEEQLPHALTDDSGPLFDKTQKHILTFPSGLGASTTPRREEIDGRGTALWNLCTRLRRNYDLDKPQEVPIILLVTRVFAFLLLDCALENGKGGTDNLLRVMKVGIKAAKNCIGGSHWMELEVVPG